MSLVRFQGLSKSFDRRPVLRDVFLRVAREERVGLIGKNGSGKTTLLKLVLGQDTPTHGTLSGGQRARVALAQCLLSGASTIVLDEPTNHLDLTSTQVMNGRCSTFRVGSWSWATTASSWTRSRPGSSCSRATAASPMSRATGPSGSRARRCQRTNEGVESQPC